MYKFLGVAAALILAGQVTHAATYSALGFGDCNTETESQTSDANAVSIVTGGGAPGCGTDVKANSGPGSVGVFASFASNSFVPGAISPIGTVRASATLTDRVFIVPDGNTLAAVGDIPATAYERGLNSDGLMDMSMRFGFSGTVNAGTSSLNGSKSKSALAELDLFINVTATTGGCCGAFDPFDYQQRIFQLGNWRGVEGSEQAPRSIIRRFAHDPLVGIDVRLQMGALATVGGFGGSSDNAAATASSLNSLGYIKNAPVFELPHGFTAFSESGAIVNNRFVDPTVIAAVPLPAGMPLLLAAFGSFALMRQRKKV